MVRVVFGVALVCSILVARTPGQEDSEVAGPSAPAVAPVEAPASEGPIQESRPSAYILLDFGEGAMPAGFPGLTIEDIEAIYYRKEQQRAPAQPPRYSVQRLTARGTARSDYVDVTIEMQILTHDDSIVKIPLGFGEGVIPGEEDEGPESELIGYQGKGECALYSGAGEEGYFALIQGSPEAKQHKLTLRLLVPHYKVGDETHFSLSFPRAVKSDFRLKVPQKQVAGEVVSGGVLESAKASGSLSEFTIHGVTEDFEFLWRRAKAPSAEVEPALWAEGAIKATLDDRGVRTEATFTVRSYGGPFEKFRILLPVGAVWVPGNPTEDYTLDDVTSEVGDGRTVVEARLSAPTMDAVVVHVETRHPRSAADETDRFELSDFQVLEAEKHSGFITVRTTGNWLVHSFPIEAVRRVEEMELPSELQDDDVESAFAYSRQPCSLKARVGSRETRVHVKPEYQILVDQDQVLLKASLRYLVLGEGVHELRMALPGWQFDRVSSDSFVTAEGVTQDDQEELLIPLSGMVEGELVLLIEAHREMPRDVVNLELPLPLPKADWVEPSTVVIVPGDSVELTTDNEKSLGLARQVSRQVTPRLELPDRQQAPLLFRGQAEDETRFVAEVTFHARRIDVETQSRIFLTHDDEHVEQTFTYSVAYAPLDTLVLNVPRAQAESGDLEMYLDGSPVDPRGVVGPTSATDQSEYVEQRIVLREPRFEPCSLEVHYPLDPLELQPQTTIPRDVLLAVPLGGNVIGNEVEITTNQGVTVNLKGEESPWAVSERASPLAGPSDRLLLTSAEAVDRVALNIHLEDAGSLGTTVVEQAWVQTYLENDVRKDRAVFRFTSSESRVVLVVPPGVDTSQVDVVLDGAPADPVIEGEGEIILPLDPTARRSHTLDMWYFVDHQPTGSRLSLTLPHFGNKVWVRRMYWQLILSQNQHMIVAPKNLTSEFRWGWNGAFFGRVPMMEQAELENWVGAVPLTPVSRAKSRYLFSGLGPVETCELRTASRSWIVLTASGAALVIGLLLIYVPSSRYVGAFLGVGILLVCALLLRPAPTLLVAQAASLGIGLTLFAGLLHRSVSRRRHRLVPHESPSSILDRRATDTPIPSTETRLEPNISDSPRPVTPSGPDS